MVNANRDRWVISGIGRRYRLSRFQWVNMLHEHDLAVWMAGVFAVVAAILITLLALMAYGVATNL